MFQTILGLTTDVPVGKKIIVKTYNKNDIFKMFYSGRSKQQVPFLKRKETWPMRFPLKKKKKIRVALRMEPRLVSRTVCQRGFDPDPRWDLETQMAPSKWSILIGLLITAGNCCLPEEKLFPGCELSRHAGSKAGEAPSEPLCSPAQGDLRTEKHRKVKRLGKIFPSE